MRLGSPEISLLQNQARCMLTSLLAQMLVLLLCHSVHILASKLRPRLTFDPPPKDLLSFKRDFLPVWKRYSFEPYEINPNVCQSSAWADLLKAPVMCVLCSNFSSSKLLKEKNEKSHAAILVSSTFLYCRLTLTLASGRRRLLMQHRRVWWTCEQAAGTKAVPISLPLHTSLQCC